MGNSSGLFALRASYAGRVGPVSSVAAGGVADGPGELLAELGGARGRDERAGGAASGAPDTPVARPPDLTPGAGVAGAGLVARDLAAPHAQRGRRAAQRCASYTVKIGECAGAGAVCAYPRSRACGCAVMAAWLTLW
jgi:hypothetical protein